MQTVWSTAFGVRRCEAVRYSAFGVPTAIASGDFDGDGDEDSEDSDFMLNLLAQNPVPYSVVADLDLDGDVDEDDDALQLLTSGGGHGLLSTSGVANRRGYAGYEHDWAIDSLCHVRHRAYLTDLGRWTRRDPLGYVEGMSLYAYVANRAMVRTDETGLIGDESRLQAFRGGRDGSLATDSDYQPKDVKSPPGGTGPCLRTPDDPRPCLEGIKHQCPGSCQGTGIICKKAGEYPCCCTQKSDSSKKYCVCTPFGDCKNTDTHFCSDQ